VRVSHKRFTVANWGELPPIPEPSIHYFRAELPRHRSGLQRAFRVVVWLTLALLATVLGAVGGVALWVDRSLSALQAHSPAVIRAEKQLAVALPGHPAVALLLGDNQRVGRESSAGGRSDTIMLVRADPATKTISLLSLPRDLQVPVYCPGSSVPRATTRIDYAFAWCGPAGSLDTVRRLTGLQINYLITVDFHGFKEIVNDLGGVWLDIDRRYYNKNDGSAGTDYSNINLQPGYQRLSGGSALQFVRFRHTDSDFFRVARQQEFLKALKDQIARNFDPLELPRIVSDLVHNVEVGSKHSFNPVTAISYALFAVTLPSGHVFQNYVDRNAVADVFVGGADELSAPPSAIHQAVEQFLHPDLGASHTAAAVALGVKSKHAAPLRPGQTTVTVLNGNGVPGAAALATHLLNRRGYVTVLPADGVEPNAPSSSYFHTEVYYDARRPGAREAAGALARLFVPADVYPLPASRALLSLDPGSMVVLVLGQTFHGTLTPTLREPPAPKRTPPQVSYEPRTGLGLLRPLLSRTSFPVETPTVLESGSVPDTLPGDDPVRLYQIDPGHKAIRLVFVTSAGEFWGIEETNMPNPPILDDRSFTHRLHGRTFQLYYSGSQLHMVVLHDGVTSYWVVNTLLNSLSNETMLAIAEGLKPLIGPASRSS
jgi:LCP family protein required for cell wall assembly